MISPRPKHEVQERAGYRRKPHRNAPRAVAGGPSAWRRRRRVSPLSTILEKNCNALYSLREEKE